ncbi:ankyrin repeat domain-containing protein 13D [Pectinophora gossypiella]|uniref:ankyrin repeat domain-containing protein 13D n=1 Tax=Pectinophora gossypiella TaxID=13191 RepID=UPI00214EA877|nr:ankyrin repeat domain-containing protein 13D [Pectinophora gossypiella]
MAMTAEEVARRFPIHWLVWNNEHEELRNCFENNKYTPEELETKDTRGRTPLLLAVTLGHVESVRALIDAGADVNCEKDGWTAVQEATATGNVELLSLVLSTRDYQRHVVRSGGIPDLLRRLSLAPDFYVEMKWEFTSWVPLVSRMCPFDTYKVYKRGGNVRVDTTLVGFENNRWQRGDRTYIFRGQGRSASLVELDHELGTMWCEYLEPAPAAARAPPAPPPHVLDARLAQPLAINYLDTDKICFERNKSGIWGWRQDKTENVNGYECKVFGANNVELVSMTRSEHLPRGERRPEPRAPLAGLLAIADRDHDDPPTTPTETQEDSPRSSRSKESKEELELEPVTWEQYFSESPLERDIGRPKEIATKVQKFKATLWLCEDYPLELQEQIMPILDLMAAISSPHFAKLKDFVQMQLPAGFPVKIEIPLFHVLNARITFGNIFATDTPVQHIECIQEGDRLSCVVDDACFAIGRGYRAAGGADARVCADDEEGLLQYAIQQSLMEAGTHDDQVDVWEALRGARPSTPQPRRDHEPQLLAHEERQLQRAIEASLAAMSLPPPEPEDPETEAERELAEALAISAREQARIEQQLASEQRALDEALRLSLLDK